MASSRETTHPNAIAFPSGLSGPALRALAHAGIRSLNDLTTWTEADVAALHGMGLSGIRRLHEALAERKLHFRRDASRSTR